AANHEAAVGHALVILVEGGLIDDVHRRVEVGKVVRHGHDGVAHAVGIGVVFQHDIALAGVFFTGAEGWLLAAANALHGAFGGLGVLHASFHARYATHGIGVPLAQAFAPEGVGFT